MVRKHTRGRITGEHQEGDAKPELLLSEFAVETDTDLGIVRSVVNGDEEEVRSPRYAMAVGHFQDRLRSQQARDAYAKRPITSFFKGPKTTVRGMTIPTGYVICPACSAGATDIDDCERCDSAGIVRDEEED